MQPGGTTQARAYPGQGMRSQSERHGLVQLTRQRAPRAVVHIIYHGLQGRIGEGLTFNEVKVTWQNFLEDFAGSFFSGTFVPGPRQEREEANTAAIGTEEPQPRSSSFQGSSRNRVTCTWFLERLAWTKSSTRRSWVLWRRSVRQTGRASHQSYSSTCAPPFTMVSTSRWTTARSGRCGSITSFGRPCSSVRKTQTSLFQSGCGTVALRGLASRSSR